MERNTTKIVQKEGWTFWTFFPEKGEVRYDPSCGKTRRIPIKHDDMFDRILGTSRPSDVLGNYFLNYAITCVDPRAISLFKKEGCPKTLYHWA